MKYTSPDKYKLGFDEILLKDEYTALPGRWIGGKVGIYAKGLTTGGYARFKYFKVREMKK